MEVLVGRGDDLAVVEGLFDRGPTPGARGLLLEGPPGIGKTSLWTAGRARARRRGFRVITARPARADAEVSFLALADLLRDAPSDLVAGLPEHQRSALAAATDTGDASHGVRALYPAVLSVLRGMALGVGLVIAIDDLQWLDADTAGALGFALRRLQDGELRLLLTQRRAPGQQQLQPWELVTELERLVLQPLDLDQTRRLLHERLGLTLTWAQGRHLHKITGGNPLFLLELGRVIQALPRRSDLDQITLPDRVESLLLERVRELTDRARSALLAVALAGEASARQVISIVGGDALDEALDAGALQAAGDRIQLAHPLLGEVARQRSSTYEVRELHRAIAHAAEDTSSRALHLALATHGPDEEVARLASSAAADASQRGSNASAAILSSHALRLTAPTSDSYPERLIAAAEQRHRRGEVRRVVALLRQGMDLISAPDQRARALFLLAECDESLSSADATALRARALDSARDSSPLLRGRLLAALSTNLSVTQVSSLTVAEAYAEEAYAAALTAGDPGAVEETLAALCWARAMRGEKLDRLLATRAPGGVGASVLLYDGVDRIEAVSLAWLGETAAARERLLLLRGLAEERGEEESYVALRLHACELDVRSGRWAAAEAALEEWMHELPVVEHERSYLVRCRALLEAGRGNGEFARELALEASRSADRAGTWNELEALRALGLSQLLLDEPEAAAGSFQRVWERSRQAAVENPGVFPVGADLAQSLALAGRTEQAAMVATELADAAAAQDHRWAAAAAEGAWGHALLATGDIVGAISRFELAASRFAAMDLQLDRCRSLIALGAALRRSRRLREARETLERAVEMLESLGSPGWADTARLELARVGGRRRNEVLTSTEQRVAQLVQEGLANKLIAQRLVVSTSTVEAHLTRIYRKLGVSSRTELALALAEQSVGLSPMADGEAEP